MNSRPTKKRVDKATADVAVGRDFLSPLVTPSVTISLAEGDWIEDRFEIRKVLGDGAFGLVCAAFDVKAKCDVAIKVVQTQDGTDGDDRVETLRWEYECASKLRDIRHIARVFSLDDGWFEGRKLTFLTMELGEGSLWQWLDEKRNSKERHDEGLAIFRDVCLGIDALHEAGWLHCDLKPQNVLVIRRETGDLVGKVSDFHLAHKIGDRRRSHVSFGQETGFLSPELTDETRGKDLGPPVDIYALGALLYELLDGDPPFEAGATGKTSPTPLTGDASIYWPIVERCLQRDPRHRYANVDALLRDLNRVEKELTLSAEAKCPCCNLVTDNVECRECTHCRTDLSNLFSSCPECGRESRVDVNNCGGCNFDLAGYHRENRRRDRLQQIRDIDPHEAVTILERLIRDSRQPEDKDDIHGLRDNISQIKPMLTGLRASIDAYQFEDAIQLADRVLKFFTRHKEALPARQKASNALHAIEHIKQACSQLGHRAQFDEAEQNLLKALDEYPGRRDLAELLDEIRSHSFSYQQAYEASKGHRNRRQLRSCFEFLRESLRIAPNSLQAQDDLNAIQEAISQCEKTLQNAQQVLERALFERCHELIGSIEMQQLDMAALSAFKELAVQTQCQFESAFDEAELAYECGDLDQTLFQLNQARTCCPDSAQAREAWAIATESVDMAIEAQRQAEQAAACGEFDRMWDQLGVADEHWPLFLDERYKEELSILEQKYRQLCAQSLEYWRVGHLSAAVTTMERSLKLCPESRVGIETLHTIRGMIQESMDYVDSARQNLSEAAFGRAIANIRAVEIMWPMCPHIGSLRAALPGTMVTYERELNKARLAKRQGDLAIAKEAISRALHICPSSNEANELGKRIQKDRADVRDHLRAFDACRDSAQFQAARNHLKAVRRLWPTHPELELLGKSLIEVQQVYEISLPVAVQQKSRRHLLKAQEAVREAECVCPQSSQVVALKRQIEADMDIANWHLHEASFYFERREIRAAHEHIKAASQLWKDSKAISRMGSRVMWARIRQSIRAGVDTFWDWYETVGDVVESFLDWTRKKYERNGNIIWLVLAYMAIASGLLIAIVPSPVCLLIGSITANT